MTKSLKSIGAVFAAAIVIAGAASAAPAQGHYLTSTSAAADHHLNILRWPPRNPSFRPCIDGTVDLQADDYLHGAYMVSEKHRRYPDLYEAHIRPPVSGTYSWEVCRGWNPLVEDSLGIGHSVYQVRSTLVGHGFSHTILNSFGLNNESQVAEFPDYLYGNGNYEWGGRIALLEPPGITHPAE